MHEQLSNDEDPFDAVEDTLGEIDETIDSIEDEFQEEHAQALEEIEDEIQEIGEAVDESQEDDDYGALSALESRVSELRQKVDELQEDVGYDDGDVAAGLDEIEDGLVDAEEAIEDATLVHGWDPYVVVNGQRYDVPSRFMTPKEILQEIPDHSPNDEVLSAVGSSDSSFLSADEELDFLFEFNEFTAYDHENPYGG
jgi:DNA-binding transcriptional MerR regulator